MRSTLAVRGERFNPLCESICFVLCRHWSGAARGEAAVIGPPCSVCGDPEDPVNTGQLAVGTSGGGAMRTRRANACRGDVSATTLMIEDGAASYALQDEGPSDPVVADLCADCGAACAGRAGPAGCSVCRARLAIGLVAKYDPGFGGYCGGCAVDTATSTVRSELNDACTLAVSNAISPLRAKLHRTTHRTETGGRSFQPPQPRVHMSARGSPSTCNCGASRLPMCPRR